MTAPPARRVDMFTGHDASPVLGILATADHIHGALTEAEQLREENTALKAERAELYRQLEQALEAAARADNLEERLADLRESHQITVERLATARQDVERLTTDRDTCRAAAMGGMS